MAKEQKRISVKDVLDYVMESDEDSSIGGLSSDEEDELDHMLMLESSCSDSRLLFFNSYLYFYLQKYPKF